MSNLRLAQNQQILTPIATANGSNFIIYQTIIFWKLNKTQKDKDFNWSRAFGAIRLHRLQGKCNYGKMLVKHHTCHEYITYFLKILISIALYDNTQKLVYYKGNHEHFRRIGSKRC